VITVSGHSSKHGWAKRALERLEEELKLLGVALNHDKTRIVDTLRGEAFGFLGFDIRRVPEKNGSGHFILMTPKKKARNAVKAKIRDIIRNSGAMPAKAVMSKINDVLTGWVNYFRIGNSSRAFSEVRDYVEMKVRTLLTRRKRRQKRSIGWRRWSNEYLCDVLGLYWDWKIYPLKNAEAYKLKVIASTYSSHNPYAEGYRVSRLRKNLTSGSEGEGLETGQNAPRQSITRQIGLVWEPFFTLSILLAHRQQISAEMPGCPSDRLRSSILAVSSSKTYSGRS
jgi:hypothetical protein